jgi:hypothetical protein
LHFESRPNHCKDVVDDDENVPKIDELHAVRKYQHFVVALAKQLLHPLNNNKKVLHERK